MAERLIAKPVILLKADANGDSSGSNAKGPIVNGQNFKLRGQLERWRDHVAKLKEQHGNPAWDGRRGLTPIKEHKIMVFLAEGERHGSFGDVFWSPEDTVKRRNEASNHLSKITSLLPQHTVENILEIGSGGGGETKALQSLFPQSHILGVDRDRRAGEVASRNGIDFINLDISVPGIESELETLAEQRKINTVIALRTSFSVAQNLICWWDSSQRDKLLVFSLIREGDIPGSINEVSKQVRSRQGWLTTLAEGRMLNETGMALLH